MNSVVSNWHRFLPVARRLVTRAGWRGAWLALSYNRSVAPIALFDKVAHQQASIDWLLTAWLAANQQGFAASYSFLTGWATAYPETSGYIIPTLLNFAEQNDYRRIDIERACRSTGEWLLSLQKTDGSFPGYQTTESMVFDTGQIIFGLLSLNQRFQDPRYLSSAIRAGDWLVAQQSPAGYWLGHSHDPAQPHTYDVRISWALAELGQITKGSEYLLAAQRQADWVVSQQSANGWFSHSYLFDEPISVLHTIGYTLQGLVELGRLLSRADLVSSANRTAQALLEIIQSDQLRSYYTAEWQSVDSSICLTGLAQIALSLKRLGQLINNQAYINSGQLLDRQVATYQNTISPADYLRGGLAGSYPIWGNYLPWSLTNWSVKFYLDSLLLDKQSQPTYVG